MIPLSHRHITKTALLATSVRRSQYHCIIPWLFSHSWSGSCFLVCNGLECLCLQHTQSKWPFGKASRVIIVNYSVKLRGLLRGKQSKWAIFSSTYVKPALPLSRRHFLTSDARNICRRIRSGSNRMWIKKETQPTCTCLILISHLSAHSLPARLCCSRRELLLSQCEGWRGSTR